LTIVYGQNGELTGPNAVPNALLARWAGDRIGIKDFGNCTTIGVVHKNQIVAVALYNKFLFPNIEVTFVTASPNWASPGAVKTILRYPFQQLNCKRITATTEATNQRARAFLCRLGFKQEGYHPDATPNGDAVTYGLLRKDAARWLAEDKHEQSPSSSRT
jgi:ribosomal protein S18 acetylase RimI-like enzyme